MTVVTIVTGPRYGSDATEKYKGLNPCRFHGIQPKVIEEEKRKGSRYIKTDFVSAICHECEKVDSERTVYAYKGDIVGKWNRFNPVFDTEEQRVQENIQELRKEMESYLKLRDESQKESDRYSKIADEKARAIYSLRKSIEAP